MDLTFFNHYSHGYIVAEAGINPANVRAFGNTHSLILDLPLQLVLRAPSREPFPPEDLIFTLLTGCVFAVLPGIERLRLGAIDPLPINRLVGGAWKQDIPDRRQLTLPLTQNLLEVIERHRKTDVQLCVELQLSLLVWGQAPTYLKPKPDDPPRLGEAVTLQASLNAIITQSTWLENVLKPSGHGEVRLIEIPIGNISKLPMLHHSVAALENAEKHFKRGDYDEAAGACRVALERYFEPEDPQDPNNKKQVLKKAWQNTLGQETYVWLDAILRQIKTDTNFPHHNPTAHFSRLDAQMLITVTAVVLAFVARNVQLPSGSP